MKGARSLEKDLCILGLTTEHIADIVSKRNLDLSPQESWKEVTQTFRKLIKKSRQEELKKWHPDICMLEGAQEHSQFINDAADNLLRVNLRPSSPQPPPIVFFSVSSSRSFATDATTSWSPMNITFTKVRF